MALDLRPLPDFALRRARQGHWEEAGTAVCGMCQTPGAVNLLYLCQPCNFKDKLASLTIVAAPWGLREVRRDFGISGETNRASEYAKDKKHEADTELVANSISYDEFQRRMRVSIE